MSPAFLIGPRHMRIRGANLLITNTEISAAAASPSCEGLKRSADATRVGSHGAMFGKGLAAGIGIPV